jgi:uncharacterized protein YqgC (DUF456 family)
VAGYNERVDESDLVVALVAVGIAVGVAGTVVPLVPGLGLVVGAALAFGIFDGFGVVGGIAFAIIVALAIAGSAAGIALPRRAAGGAGAPTRSLLVGALGAVIGFFAVPIVGLPLGGAVGIFVGELARSGDRHLAWRTTKATLKGFGAATLVQLAAGLAMAATWVVWVVAA